MKKQEFADLFDIDLGDNLEPREESDPVSSFEDTCVSVKTQMKEEESLPESEPETDNDIILGAIKSKDIKEEVNDDSIDEEEIEEEDFADEIDKDMAEFSQVVAGNKTESEPELKLSSTTEEELEIKDEDIPDSPEKPSATEDNPLNLKGSDLNAYKKLSKEYPQFNLYNGSIGFREFYKFKLHYLKRLLTRFPVLDIRDMSEELGDKIPMNHVVQDDEIGPSLIMKKIGDVQRSRIRIGSLMVDILGQYYMWDRFTEILKSKLYKDHDVRGAHKKDAAIIGHMDDMETYVMDMKGFIENAKHYDSLLRASAESLSRQLTCLQLKDSLGLSPMKDDITESSKPEKTNKKPPLHDIGDLDFVETGTVISAPKKSGAVSVVKFGTQEDEFSGFGV